MINTGKLAQLVWSRVTAQVSVSLQPGTSRTSAGAPDGSWARSNKAREYATATPQREITNEISL